MKKIIGERWVELCLTISAVTLCCLFFSYVTDDYASFGFSCAAGQFSNYPYCSYYWGLLGLNYLYTLLYLKWPAYNWMGISFLAFQFLALYLILRAIKNIVFINNRSAVIVRVTQILFALFFIENIIYISHTRSSLVFCGIALVNLIFPEKITRRDFIKNVFIFILGMLIRPESGLGMALLVSVGYLIHHFNIIHLTKRAFLPFTAMGVMMFAYYMDWQSTDLFLKKVEPEVEYKLMEKRVVSLSGMQTALDSVKYQAAIHGICFDTRVMTADYFRTVLSKGSNLNLAQAYTRFLHVLSFYRYYLFIPLYVVLLFMLSFYQADYSRRILKIVLFQSATFLIVYAVDYTGGLICGRHFLNLELISLVVTSIYFFNGAISPWKQNTSIGIGCLNLALFATVFLFVIYGVAVSATNFKESSNNVVESTNCLEIAMQKLDDLYYKRVIVLTTDNFHLFDRTFSLKTKKYTRNTYLMFDVWTYYLYPEYLDYLKAECNCDPLDPTAFFAWLSANNALYIAEPWRYELTSKYMKVVHGQKLNFLINKEYTKPDCIYNTNMMAFELRKVSVTQ